MREKLKKLLFIKAVKKTLQISCPFSSVVFLAQALQYNEELINMLTNGKEMNYFYKKHQTVAFILQPETLLNVMIPCLRASQIVFGNAFQGRENCLL